MFSDLNEFLGFKRHNLERPYFVAVSEKGADSSFIIHHFLSYFLKHECRVVLVSFSQSFNHFNGVGNKVGVNLAKAREEKQLLFVEGLKHLAQAVNSYSNTGDKQWKGCIDASRTLNLTRLFQLLRTAFEEFRILESKKMVILIDNISVLLYTGASTIDMIYLVQYLNGYIQNYSKSAAIIGCQNHLGVNDEEGNTFMNYIQHIADLSLEIKGLNTGYCKDVHGQVKISVHPQPGI